MEQVLYDEATPGSFASIGVEQFDLANGTKPTGISYSIIIPHRRRHYFMAGLSRTQTLWYIFVVPTVRLLYDLSFEASTFQANA